MPWTPFADADAATPDAFNSRWTALHATDASSMASAQALYLSAALTPSACGFDPCSMVSAVSAARSAISSNDTTEPVLRSAFSSIITSVQTTRSGMSSGTPGYPGSQPSGATAVYPSGRTYGRHYRLGSSASTPEWASEMSAMTLGVTGVLSAATRQPYLALALGTTAAQVAGYEAAHPNEPILWAGASALYWRLRGSDTTLAVGPASHAPIDYVPDAGAGTGPTDATLNGRSIIAWTNAYSAPEVEIDSDPNGSQFGNVIEVGYAYSGDAPDYEIRRGILRWDTSALPSTPTSGYVRLRPTYAQQDATGPLGDTVLRLYALTRTPPGRQIAESTTPYPNTDWDDTRVAATLASDDHYTVNAAGALIGSNLDYTLNAAGRAAVNATGHTCMVLRCNYDVQDTDPALGAGNFFAIVDFKSAEQASGKPTLHLEF